MDISRVGLDRKHSRDFCRRFREASSELRYVLGRGSYASSIGEVFQLGGYVDDHTEDVWFKGLPVLRSADLPAGALVVVASMLRPRTALSSLAGRDVRTLDYFAFQRDCGLPVKPVSFWSAFREDYEINQDKYQWIRGLFSEDQSRETFDRLIQFRLTSDLSLMNIFEYDMKNQYFENFLNLHESGESFLDIGCFDGFTSLEFARRAPRFRHVTVFEPSELNREMVVRNLRPLGDDRVTIYGCGLSDRSGTLSFASTNGSASRVSDDGDTTIRVERLDDLDIHSVTFLKMDIEGGEEDALRGGIETIRRFSPRLAISVYHRPTDFWRIPMLILNETGIDYELRLRHYTEGIDETVMFFLPKSLGSALQ